MNDTFPRNRKFPINDPVKKAIAVESLRALGTIHGLYSHWLDCASEESELSWGDMCNGMKSSAKFRIGVRLIMECFGLSKDETLRIEAGWGIGACQAKYECVLKAKEEVT